ncbi:MAG: hypothetical protein JWL69_5219 [Phycisphaerales bacterium]|nr:hypothetical protein [Phycisphaerales bacterium]
MPQKRFFDALPGNLVLVIALFGASSARAASGDSMGYRYGPFALFDSRSVYGKGVFPEPFLVDDSDLEVNELRLDWLHQESKGHVNDSAKAEFEKSFGLMTLEFELPYERDTFSAFNPASGRADVSRAEGVGNVSIGARHPIYQFVSSDESVDNTFGLGLEIGIPVNSPVSKHTELVPKVFDDLRIGEHFTMQAVVGYSFLLGSDPEGGLQTLEYGLVLGYAIPHTELPLPDVEQLIPVFELRGDTPLNQGDAGRNSLVGNLAFRVNLKAIGPVQPRLGVGYVFPIDQGARNNLRWGIITSLVFDF